MCNQSKPYTQFFFLNKTKSHWHGHKFESSAQHNTAVCPSLCEPDAITAFHHQHHSHYLTQDHTALWDWSTRTPVPWCWARTVSVSWMIAPVCKCYLTFPHQLSLWHIPCTSLLTWTAGVVALACCPKIDLCQSLQSLRPWLQLGQTSEVGVDFFFGYFFETRDAV